jgi:leishmanolysin-like peptidase
MIINSTRIATLKDFFPKIQSKIQEVISVQRVQGALSLSGVVVCGAKGGVPVSSSSYSNTDLLIFVTARPSPPGADDINTVAWAISCALDQKGRAIAGQVNINPAKFFGNEYSNQFYTVLHELTHVLGISSSRFPYYIDEHGKQRENVVTTVKRVVNGVEQSVSYLTTPSIVAAAKMHFNCSTAIGAELEEYGSSGT